MNALRRVPHILVRFAAGKILLIMLPRWIKLPQFVVNRIPRRPRSHTGLRSIGSLAWEYGWTWKGRTHHHHGAKDVRPDEGTPRRQRRAKIVTDYRFH